MIQFKQITDTNEGQEVNMLPLVDIIFNLLIFFLITATISTRGINLDLPQASSSVAISTKNQEIVLNQNGEIFYNNVKISLKRLQVLLEARLEASNDHASEQLTLKAHEKVSFGLFISVMDMARKIGYQNLIVATDPKRE